MIVVLPSPIHPDGIALLQARPDIRVVEAASPAPADLAPALREADAVLLRGTPFPAELLDLAPKLRLVSRHGVGLDNVPLAACRERGVAVAHVGAVNAPAVAEQTIALLLAVMRQVPAHDRAVREGRYGVREALETRDVAGRTLLLLGFGRIGREVARLASCFRMRVLAHDPGLDPGAIRAAGCEPVAAWRDALPGVDVLSLHLPLAPETRHLVGPEELARLPAEAVVLNCARGGLLDESALDRALRERRLFGAGLDVTGREPPDADNPLLANPRVVLSPHSAALTRECAVRMATRSAQNVIDFFDGRLAPDYLFRG